MTSSFINDQKRVYKALHPCFCPAIEETVYFNSEGLNHLLYQRRRPRSPKERYYRAGLIPCLSLIVKESKKAIKEIQSKDPLIITWVLSHEVEINNKKQIVKVVLKKKGAGKTIFLSAMRKKYINN